MYTYKRFRVSERFRTKTNRLVEVTAKVQTNPQTLTNLHTRGVDFRNPNKSYRLTKRSEDCFKGVPRTRINDNFGSCKSRPKL